MWFIPERSFWLSCCLWLQLEKTYFLWFIDESAYYLFVMFCHERIMKCPKVLKRKSSNRFFCPTYSSNFEDQSFTIRNDGEKWQILKKLEPDMFDIFVKCYQSGHMEFYRQSEKTCWYRKNAEYWPWQSARLTISLMLWLCISESFLHFGRMVHPSHLCVQVTHENVFVKYFDWVIIK